MGLDMDLQGHIYGDKVKFITDFISKEYLNGLALSRYPSLKFDLMTWRKANAIHEYFVNLAGVDDCQPYYVSKEDLDCLLDLCEKVLAEPEKAPDLLPTRGGFFFGSTEYDEWYLGYVKETRDFLKAFIPNFDKFDLISYQACW